MLSIKILFIFFILSCRPDYVYRQYGIGFDFGSGSVPKTIFYKNLYMGEGLVINICIITCILLYCIYLLALLAKHGTANEAKHGIAYGTQYAML